MGNLLGGGPKAPAVDPAVEQARQQAAADAAKAKADAAAQAAEDKRQLAAGMRGRRSLLSSAGSIGYPSQLGNG